MKVSFPVQPQSVEDLRQARGKTPQTAEVKAAQEFEQIFVRKMLSSLEKTGRMGEKSSISGGSDVYSSMVVDALSNSIAASGGIGLADMVVRSIQTRKPSEPDDGPAPQATKPQLKDQST